MFALICLREPRGSGRALGMSLALDEAGAGLVGETEGAEDVARIDAVLG